MNNEVIKDVNESQGIYECWNFINEDDQFIDVGISIGKSDNWCDVIEEVVDFVGFIERSLKIKRDFISENKK